ncbi:CLUMA_CG012091, isoform A [Clunio marinus]|uniref:CLUMA_CG012091, isoform A n=1 Tax=Clunio marinus TaxID=568069 RepID=A0A1J1IGE4_9DIPT|nr:CLUMA_CG012091, isoform A [Clunio marinus]
MKMDPSVDNALIKKETLYAGTKYVSLTPGTKIKFHFETKRADNLKVVDDSRKINKPMELVLGKKFKLEVWEVIVQKMSLNEVAKFTVDKSLVQQYPFVSKTIRDAYKKPEERKHCCGMTLQNEGIGYHDLDELFHSPCDLIFTIEVLSIELPEEYEKETWQLNEDEKLKSIEDYRIRGNQKFKESKLKEAEELYSLALGVLEQLMLKEKPKDEEWLALAKIKVPLLLNFAQCKLLEKDFYRVIECCTEVLTYEPDNLKALYRRGKGHIGAWNPNQAQEDLNRCISLDPSLKSAITKEINSLKEKIKSFEDKDKSNFQKLF